MNYATKIVLPFAILTLISTNVNAQAGTNKWASGYPKTGTNKGTILIKGTATPETGKSLSGSGLAVAVPVGGGLSAQQAIAVNKATGEWGEVEFTGLASGTSYNIIVQVAQNDGTSLATDPKTATAK